MMTGSMVAGHGGSKLTSAFETAKIALHQAGGWCVARFASIRKASSGNAAGDLAETVQHDAGRERALANLEALQYHDHARMVDFLR